MKDETAVKKEETPTDKLEGIPATEDSSQQPQPQVEGQEEEKK